MSAKVVVPDHQLSLAIGKEGQNARLAAKLTGWRIDIKSESQAKDTNFITLEELSVLFDKTLAEGDENAEVYDDEYYDDEYYDDEYYDENGEYYDDEYYDDEYYDENGEYYDEEYYDGDYEYETVEGEEDPEQDAEQASKSEDK
jgi:N utilization substance protein A